VAMLIMTLSSHRFLQQIKQHPKAQSLLALRWHAAPSARLPLHGRQVALLSSVIRSTADLMIFDF